MKKLLLLFFLLFAIPAVAQDKIPITEQDYQNDKVEMADTFRADGKIYVVVLIIGIILAGIILYLVVVDVKVSKLEKEIKMLAEHHDE